MKKKIYIIIPARKGSKGIKNKNLKKINKRSLIDHAINHASKINFSKKIILTTNIKKLINFNKSNRYIIDKRPEYLCSDRIHTSKVVLYICKKYSLHKEDYVILLQPTSPIRNLKIINENIKFFLYSNFQSMISVSDAGFYDNNIRFLNKRKLIGKDLGVKQRQYSKRVYYVNGNFFMAKIKNFLTQKSFHIKNKTTYFVTDRSKSIDINNKSDLLKARSLFS